MTDKTITISLTPEDAKTLLECGLRLLLQDQKRVNRNIYLEDQMDQMLDARIAERMKECADYVPPPEGERVTAKTLEEILEMKKESEKWSQ